MTYQLIDTISNIIISTTIVQNMNTFRVIRRTSNKQYRIIYRDLNKLYEEVITISDNPQSTYPQNSRHLRSFNKKIHGIREKLANASLPSAGGALKVAAAALYMMYMNMLPERRLLAEEQDLDHYKQEFEEWIEKARVSLS
jgi:transcription initiation factor TFIIIB Brf1 subunit/transcription initiation factor TFIIB